MMFYALSGPNLPGSPWEIGLGKRSPKLLQAVTDATDGAAALQKPWDFLSRATRIQELGGAGGRIAFSGKVYLKRQTAEKYLDSQEFQGFIWQIKCHQNISV